MSKTFDEEMFVLALCERDEDCRVFSRNFNPNWLKDKELVPVVESVFEFRRKHGMPPSLEALNEYMEEQDSNVYNSRWAVTLTSLGMRNSDQSKMVLALHKAKSSGAALALESLIQTQSFQQHLTNGDGDELLKQTQLYLSQWSGADEGEGTYNIRDAFNKLIDDNAWNGRPDRIASGIYPLDQWTNGGLRPRQLGIIMAPTGGGKSAVLLNIAHYVATVDMLPVLLLTNELTVNEQSERFLVRMQKPKKDHRGKLIYRTLQEVQDDPSVAYKGLKARWAMGLENRLYITSVDIGETADDLEDRIKRLRLETGFKPAVIVVDYMERMAPSTKMNREKEWIWMGEVAKELVRLGKRTDTLVWTAVQTNRGGLSKSATLDMTHGQGSIRHFQEAAFVGSVKKMTLPLAADGEQDVPCLEFAEQKQRHNAFEDRASLVRHDLSRMYISDEIIEKPEDGEEPVADDDTTQKPAAGVLSPWVAKAGK